MATVTLHTTEASVVCLHSSHSTGPFDLSLIMCDCSKTAGGGHSLLHPCHRSSLGKREPFQRGHYYANQFIELQPVSNWLPDFTCHSPGLNPTCPFLTSVGESKKLFLCSSKYWDECGTRYGVGVGIISHCICGICIHLPHPRHVYPVLGLQS